MEFFTKLLLFYVSVFWPRGMWDLSSPTRDQTVSPELEGQVLTTGPPGKSQNLWIFVLQHRSSQDRVVSGHLDLTVFMS